MVNYLKKEPIKKIKDKKAQRKRVEKLAKKNMTKLKPMRKLQVNNSKFPLNLPHRDIELLGWKAGDDILIDTDIKKGIMVLRKNE